MGVVAVVLALDSGALVGHALGHRLVDLLTFCSCALAVSVCMLAVGSNLTPKEKPNDID